MCEPMHSIVQFPSQDDDGNPTDTKLDALPSQAKESWFDWGRRKIGEWFHFSKMGFGHSETIGLISPKGRRYLPDETRYETAWWERKTVLDGYFSGHRFLKDDALKAADDYARTVSIGNMTQLRQFLTNSIKRSERPQTYIQQFYQMIVVKGRDLLRKKLNQFNDSIDTTIKILMSFTRKRNLLVPEWADDTKIWLPA